ncbi:hypothetical protein F5Y13DRAFT_196988 [Hypoxylon sp. FL1857]|nr:hypothetical protein F5Y13DRAFT_196988 [Hypoxylon sp. FL1857]
MIMAETLGVATSSIAVAQITLQVGSTILKLKKLWDEINDVPDYIADLMEQIECFNPILWEAENSFNQCGLPPTIWDELASKSTAIYSRKALENLTGMVDDLSIHIHSAKKGRKKLTGIKVLLKKNSLRKLERRLENAVRMLTLAQQSYLVALTRVQPDIIVERFAARILRDSQSMPRMRPDSGANREERETSSSLTRRSGKLGPATRPHWRVYPRRPSLFGRVLVDTFDSGHMILLEAPLWLAWRSWELHSIKANGAWQWNLRSYTLVPFDSKGMNIAKGGSPQDMGKLFDTGLASPYDRCPDGRTLLHSAAVGNNLEMVRFLMGIGLSPWDGNQMYPAYCISIYPRNETFVQQILSDLILAKDFFIFSGLEYPEPGEFVDPSLFTCSCRGGLYNVETYKALLPYQCPLHHKTPLASRLRAAIWSLKNTSSCLEVIQLILEPEWSSNPQAVFSNTGTSMIWAAAVRLCRAVCDDEESTQPNAASVPCWFAFAVDIIKQAPDIHATDDDMYGKTAFIQALHTTTIASMQALCATSFFTPIIPLPRFLKLVYSVLRTWLNALEHAGVDLNAYGQCEHKLLAENDFLHRFKTTYHSSRNPSLPTYLVGFEFGPRPEDWVLYWHEPTDEFAGDFWKLIDDSPLRIPGSWVD